jgi:spermidine synthase
MNTFLFPVTIFLSAFLLFLVQPIIAKQILPWFGGSAAVWTTCMVFFQVSLLAGYAYSDWMIRKVSRRQQALIHISLLALSLALLPIIPPEFLKPIDGDNPASRILLLLTVTIGLPYFLLSTTGPLVQAWFAKAVPNGNVYRLYALSNIGSLLSLALYPLAIEPNSNATLQSIGWSFGYGLFAVLVGCLAWFAANKISSTGNTDKAASEIGRHTNSPRCEQLIWLSLAAIGSALLLTVTTHITQNIASIPFLWVLPLAIYLISFILTFDSTRWYKRGIYVVLTAVLGTVMIAGLQFRWGDEYKIESGLMHLAQALPLYCLGLFVLTMFCHGELVLRKPATGQLTRFYLMISLGGAIGGLFVGLAAPLLFNTYQEFPIAICLLFAVATFVVPNGWMRWLSIAIGGVCLGFAGYNLKSLGDDALVSSRNFYGSLRVKATSPDTDPNATWRLVHGVILHGEQYRSEKFKRLATTYYGASSGVGKAIEGLRHPGMKVGLIGMGVGTLAVYGQAKDTYRFYELNPAVYQLAKSHFSNLKDSLATIEVDLGDARLSLEKDSPQGFDVLAVDAFSSDSIPVHLITREAIQLYKRHLKANGVIAFHISNRYLDLSPVVRQLADDVGMRAVQVIDVPDKESYLYRSDWVLVSANDAFLQAVISTGGEEVKRKLGMPPWTDSYNNLLQILK